MSWLQNFSRSANPACRLIGFPYAGGGAAIFRGWPAYLESSVEVWGVQLPGRGARMLEEPLTSIRAMVDALLPELLPLLDRPFAFFGHSMGGMLALETARALAARGAPAPRALFACASHGPGAQPNGGPMHTLDDAVFLAALSQMGATPAEVLAEPELMELLLPMLRADFTAIETHDYRAQPALACPIVVFGGLDDREVSLDALLAWRAASGPGFRAHLFPGDHFFTAPDPRPVLDLLRASLAA